MALKSVNNKGESKITNEQADNALAQAFSQVGEEGSQAESNYRMGERTTGTKKNKHFSWVTFGNMTSSQVVSGAQGVALSALEQAMRELAEKDPNSSKWKARFIPLDMDAIPNLAVSSLVVAFENVTNKELPVAYVTLLISDSIGDIPPRREILDGMEYEVRDYPYEGYDETMVKIIYDEVKVFYPKTIELLSADMIVVPNRFDVEDKDAVSNLFYVALLACRKELDEANSDLTALNLANALDDSQLHLDTTLGDNNILDALGQPLRSDITLQLKAMPIQQQGSRNVIENQARRRDIARVNGFVDIIWDSEENENKYQRVWAGRTNREPSSFYRARFVVTDMFHSGTQTLEGTLMSLLLPVYLADTDYWINALMPVREKAKDQPLHDIGNLGWDADLTGTGEYGYIQTTPDVFSYQDLLDFVGAFFHPGLVISIDAPLYGPLTWQVREILESALDPNSDATASIMHAAMELTNGHIEKYIDVEKCVPFKVEPSMIPLGYYKAADGKRDIRDVDYLAVAGSFGPTGDRDAITNYIQTFSPQVGNPEVMCLSQRRQYITDILGGSVEFTGEAYRINVVNEFLQALKLASRDCRLSISPQRPFYGNNSRKRMSSGDILQYVNGLSGGETIYSNRSAGSSYGGRNYRSRYI